MTPDEQAQRKMSNENAPNFQARPSAEVMELVDIPKPDAPEAVGLSAAGKREIKSIYGEL